MKGPAETLLPEGTTPRDDDFRVDPKITSDRQVDNRRGYRGTHNPWDRGHLVRQASLHWGDPDLAKRDGNESFFRINIAPRHTSLHSGALG